MVGRRGSDIVEPVVRELPAGVARKTVRLACEQDEAVLRRIRNRSLVAFDPTVKRCKILVRWYAQKPLWPERLCRY